jgi:hypothetical protein
MIDRGTYMKIFTMILLIAIIVTILSGCKPEISSSAVSCNTIKTSTITTFPTMNTFTATTSALTISTGDLNANNRQTTINKLGTLLSGYSAPKDYTIVSARQNGWFDANDFFKVFDHLSMQSGYTLDYLYVGNGSIGQPFLYARKLDSQPCTTIGQLPAQYDYLTFVQPDDTPDSYFQYIALRIMGGQFYLFWHAGYNDTTIVCTHDVLESTTSQFPDAVAGSARQINLTPEVTMNKDTATVRVVTFTKWGGFKEETFKISRSSSHSIIQQNTKTLVAWNCGTTY